MFQWIIDILFPKTCAGCHNVLTSAEKTLCTSCRHKIPLTNHLIHPQNEALKIFYGRVDVQFVATFCYFTRNGIVQNIIHNLKYRGHQEIGSSLGIWFAALLKNCTFLPSFDFIIPIPLHPKKQKQRGYNQVDTFALAISTELQIPVRKDVLYRRTFNQSQSKKSKEQRETIIDNTFYAVSLPELHNKHFLLIDDVLTTGATLESCAKNILQIPNAKVSIICIALSH